ncbi:uncharacterized protein LOC113342296 [Papaver somniferum]|uniref:uncharacterized protein LOC113342296 n=1 Tax=Papaver somniferum TaxID=3469 RepID=UPI000E6F5CA5|nr:uncharacterized protein LOC113342296 [Papaver somniferum]XP_026442670.1 uncharacterized protein LOC113342296 [Papaver somniferum]
MGTRYYQGSDELAYQCWKRADDLVGSWILNSCQPDIRASCLYAPSSHAIWKDLQVRFCISNAPILYRLKSAIAAIRQDSMSVSLYYTKIKTLWDQYDSLIAVTEVCICGAGKSLLERLERDRAMEFLQGLHDGFSNLRSQILLMDPFPTALRIFNMVQQEEEQQHITASPLPNIESAALSTNRYATQSSANRSSPSTSHNKWNDPTAITVIAMDMFETVATVFTVFLILLHHSRLLLTPPLLLQIFNLHIIRRYLHSLLNNIHDCWL